MVSKLVGGVLAVALAYFMTRTMTVGENIEEDKIGKD